MADLQDYSKYRIKFEIMSANVDDSHVKTIYSDAYYIVPTSRPLVAPPSVKQHVIDVPGVNGSIDLTESITPYPTYGNRTGSWEFAVRNEKPYTWQEVYSMIQNDLQGRLVKVTLQDDPDWFYRGRIAVSDWKSNNDGTWSTITLNYSFEPYKYYKDLADNDEHILQYKNSTNAGASGSPITASTNVFKNITVNGDIVDGTYTNYGINVNGSYKFNRDHLGVMPIVPTIKITNIVAATGVRIRISNAQLGAPVERTFKANGTYTDPQFVFYDAINYGWNLYIDGKGKVTFRFRRGSL